MRAFLQGAVYCWCKNRKDDWFAARDLLGGNNYYWQGTPLIPLYDYYLNGNEENHLVLIEADTKYQALLTALSIYECNDVSTNYHPNETWTVDMNYNEYQEYPSPESIFTYMNRYDKMILSESESFESVLSESVQSAINKEDICEYIFIL